MYGTSSQKLFFFFFLVKHKHIKYMVDSDVQRFKNKIALKCETFFEHTYYRNSLYEYVVLIQLN